MTSEQKRRVWTKVLGGGGTVADAAKATGDTPNAVYKQFQRDSESPKESDHLYRDDYATFEDYCRERWDMPRQHAYRLIESTAVCHQLVTLGAPVPSTESQARELVGLEPCEAQEVMEAAHKSTA
ncbi:hypothetical protein [Gordonia sp. DT101]|uniref:hypothetical protein n=1 Tax=Gordonia sp. DT101 TaxID=3416545 RepID=UPI003CF196CA